MTPITIGEWTFKSADYDADADVLYLSIDEPVAGYGEETPEGHILRFDEGGNFAGVTLIDIGALLDDDEFVGVTLPSRPVQIDRDDLELALA